MFEPTLFAESIIGSYLWGVQNQQSDRDVTRIISYPARAYLINMIPDQDIYLPKASKRFHADGVEEDIVEYEIAGFISTLLVGTWQSIISVLSNQVTIPDTKLIPLWYDLRDMMIATLPGNQVACDGWYDFMQDLLKENTIKSNSHAVRSVHILNQIFDGVETLQFVAPPIYDIKQQVGDVYNRWTDRIHSNPTSYAQMQQDLMEWLYQYRLCSIEEIR